MIGKRRARTLERQLPRGIAAVYVGGNVSAVVINARLGSARRQGARRAILSTPCEIFDVVKIAELSA